MFPGNPGSLSAVLEYGEQGYGCGGKQGKERGEKGRREERGEKERREERGERGERREGRKEEERREWRGEERREWRGEERVETGRWKGKGQRGEMGKWRRERGGREELHCDGTEHTNETQNRMKGKCSCSQVSGSEGA